MLCPKCNREMARGILGGRGSNFFLPEGKTYPVLLSDRTLKKKNATLLPPSVENVSWVCEAWPKAHWCDACKLLVADYEHLMTV